MNILIADDEALSRELLAALCKQAGHSVTVTENGKDAWALLDDPKRWFDVAFLDLAMPGCGGLDLLKRLRASPLHRQVEAIICTASNDRSTINEAIAHGARYYIVKPCTAETVNAKLHQLEAKRQAAGRTAGAVPVSTRKSARQPA